MAKKEIKTQSNNNTENSLDKIDTKEAEKKTETKKRRVVPKEELADYHELMDYVFNTIFPDMKAPSWCTSQIRDYRFNLNLSYKGMLNTLKYYYEFLEHDYPYVPNLGIIPEYYVEAQQNADEVGTQERHYQNLIEYICQLFKDEELQNSPKIKANLFQYRYQYNCSFRGMKSTLEYYYEITQHPIPEKPTIGIIPYYYEEAKDYWIKKKEIDKQEGINKVPVVKVFLNSEKRKQYQNTFDMENSWRSKENLISLDEIEVDENERVE